MRLSASAGMFIRARRKPTQNTLPRVSTVLPSVKDTGSVVKMRIIKRQAPGWKPAVPVGDDTCILGARVAPREGMPWSPTPRESCTH